MDEDKLLRDIERMLNLEIPKVALEGYEPDPSIKAEPIQNGRNNNGGSRSRIHNGFRGRRGHSDNKSGGRWSKSGNAQQRGSHSGRGQKRAA